MYSAWFSNFAKAIVVLHSKLPNLTSFNSIHANAYGDFVIKDDVNSYIVKHTDWSVWKLEGQKWEHE